MKNKYPRGDLFLERLLSGLADSLESVSDEQLFSELRERGEDPEAMAREVRGVLAGAVKRFRQRNLEKAKSDHALAVKTFTNRSRNLPTDMLSKRALLARVLASRPDLSGLTAQWRGRDSDVIPDVDVDDLLNQLEALGLLDEQ